MEEADFKFGIISIVLKSDKLTAIDLSNDASKKIQQYIPQYKKMMKLERQQIANNMKLLKGKADCSDCDDECDDECGHPKKDLEIKNLYV